MFSRSVTLFHLFGFAVRLHVSWLIVVVLVLWSLAMGFFPAQYPGLPAQTYWWMGVLGAVLLFASIVIHELFHSLAARRYGIPMTGITLFVFGGVAEMEDDMPNPASEFLMAAAGPGASLLIGLISYGVYQSRSAAWPVEAVAILEYFCWANLMLAAFNLLPAFPLDGGRMLRAALWAWKHDLRRATRAAGAIGSAFGLALMALGVLQFVAANFLTGVWWMLVGIFLRRLSRSAYGQVLLKSTLRGKPVSRFMRTDAVAATADLTIEELFTRYMEGGQVRLVPVITGVDILAGCVTPDEVESVPRGEWSRHQVSEIVSTCSAENTVEPGTDSLRAVSLMNRFGVARLMVVDGARLAGVVSLRDILAYVGAQMRAGRSSQHAV